MFNEYPDVVTIQELQSMLGIGKNKAYELLNSNVIKSYRNGKKFIIPKISVINFLLNIQ